jgi:hypothetical protein
LAGRITDGKWIKNNLEGNDLSMLVGAAQSV